MIPARLAAASPLFWFPLAKLLLHVASAPGYGYFRDEFYYLACADRLAWGYVDHPPLSIAVLAVVEMVFGDSLYAIRLFPALAGAVTVLLVGLMTRRMGGAYFAQSLAMLAALIAPIYLALDHYYSMNALDVLIWAAVAYALVELLAGGSPRIWLGVGALLGLGLLNKISVLWLGLGLLVGLVATERRAWLKTRWPWLAASLALLILSPHVAWQMAHGFPTAEFIQHATSEKMASVSLLGFVKGQLEMLHFFNAPIWLAGLGVLLFGAQGSRFRMLGWAYLTVFGLLAWSGSSRAGYLSPAYTWLFPAGALFIESRLRSRSMRITIVAALALGGTLMAPAALPLLPVETYIRYARALGIEPSTEERKDVGALSQFYADMHGWDSVVRAIAVAYGDLSEEERQRAVIFTSNYGEAGAVDLLGRAHGLPRAVSGHNNYWLWGPGQTTGDVVILMAGSREDLEQSCADVQLAATTDCGYCMPYENRRPIWVCRGFARPLSEVWPSLKHFD